MDVQRLRDEPSYWDNFAHGATHFAPRPRVFYKKTASGWQHHDGEKWVEECEGSFPAVVINKPEVNRG